MRHSIQSRRVVGAAAFTSMFCLITATTVFAHARPSNPHTASTMHHTGLPSAAMVRKALGNLPFSTPDIQVPKIPARVFNIDQYGAEAGNLSQAAVQANTTAINEAISDASQAGGGEVVVPPGFYGVGSIVLESNVNLHVDRGAYVEFSSDHTNFPLIQQFGQTTYQAPLYANGVTNVAITGGGIFNGNGNTWNPVKEFQLTATQWQTLIQSGGVVNNQEWYPSTAIMQDPNLIPFMVFVLNSKNIVINGPTFENSPSEAMYINFSNNIIVSHATIENPWYSVNTVGMDISADTNVLLDHNVINTGDDDIALNSSPGSQPDTLNHVVIENSTIWNGHGGVAFGSYTNGGMTDVLVRNVSFNGTEDGIRFKSAVGRGGLVQNIYFNNLQMQNIQDYAFSIDADYNNQSPVTGSLSALKYVPQFENIVVNHLIVDYAGQAIRIAGLAYAPVSNVSLSNITFKAAKQYTLVNAEHVAMTNVSYQPATELGVVYHYGISGPGPV
jgi:polygalacturonase